MPAPAVAPIIVYLSSTLADLAEERQAVKDVLAGSCVVRESYDPSDASLVEKCLADVGTSEIFIGIIGLRYGFTPPGRKTSITELEYEQAKARGLPRFVFVKNEKAIFFVDTDAHTGENPKERITEFRSRLTSGADDEATPARFSTTADLKLAVQKMISDVRMSRSGGPPLMKGEPAHPWAIVYELAIGCVPGTDQLLQSTLESLARSDRRVGVFDLSPGVPKEYLPTLDAQARRSRSVMIGVTPASLSRIAAIADDIAASIAIVRERSAGVFGLLVDVKPEALPAAVRDALSDIFQTTTSDWSGASGARVFEQLQQWRRARAPEAAAATRVAVPYMVVALNESEVEAMHADPDSFLAPFGQSAPIRRAEFDALSRRLKQVSPKWPKGFYTADRKGWRPFGPAAETMNEFVLSVARRLNRAERGTRERRLLRGAQIAMVPYAFDESVTDRSGSRSNLGRVCDLGCLVLLDEFALLHPTLRRDVDRLLGSNNAAVVSITACDPTLRPLGELLGELWDLKVGNLLSRFSHLEDLRCELALNSAERLQRWLRLVLPELVTTLGQDQIDPELAGSVDELLKRGATALP